uniref:CYP6JB2 n=1 Tax=Apolygus lucorum TaxID=248454 RepID=A0A2D1C034_APOLU|nr:CYP6JB2 [Apolygus lucorum]
MGSATESALPFFIECVLTFFCAFLTTALFYLYINSPFKYWRKLGVPHVKVNNFLFGDFWQNFWLSQPKLHEKAYYDFPKERYVGIFSGVTFRKPSLLLRDPDLVEAVLVRDFSYLSARGVTDDPNSGPTSKHLLNLGGEHWKIMRNKLTPTFSSGKLKGMHSQLVDCGDALLGYMKEFEDGKPFEARDVITRFTMDVIASCAFGLNLDTINNPENGFRRMALRIFTPSLRLKIFMFIRGVAPWILPWVGSLLRKGKSGDKNFFVDAVEGTLEYRKENKVERPDFLHLTNELKLRDLEMIKNKEIDPNSPFIFDHNSLLSNAFVFFIAGFETTATTLSNAMFELAVNPEVQDRLHKEIAQVLEKHDGQPSYSALQEMVYMEQVISETLRKYPPLSSLGRKVVKEYRIPGSDLVLSEGSTVEIPVHMIHHDPQYFPEPEKFRPERFNNGKDAIRKGTYVPFGGGPRVCIGERFAKLEAKLCLAMMLSKHEIVKRDKTSERIEFEPNAILLAPKGGIWVAIRPRSS